MNPEILKFIEAIQGVANAPAVLPGLLVAAFVILLAILTVRWALGGR